MAVMNTVYLLTCLCLCAGVLKDDFISQFTFDDFVAFYHKLCGRHEVHVVFRHLYEICYVCIELHLRLVTFIQVNRLHRVNFYCECFRIPISRKSQNSIL